MNKAPVIKGKNVLLRQPIESDVIDYFNMAINPLTVNLAWPTKRS
ncbi:hypothetical protein V7654_23795 [Bacillus sp. JJ1609]